MQNTLSNWAARVNIPKYIKFLLQNASYIMFLNRFFLSAFLVLFANNLILLQNFQEK